MSIFMPFNQNPDSNTTKIDGDGLQTVPVGKYWKLSVQTATGSYISINGIKTQSREANHVTVAGGSGIIYTVTAGMRFDGIVGSNGSGVTTLSIGGVIVCRWSAASSSGVYLTAPASQAFVVAGADTVGVAGIEFVDGPTYGEYWLTTGETFQVHDSTNFGGAGRVSVQEYSIP